MLQNVYLCSSKHNNVMCRFNDAYVVNCFKMCIFAVASTISVAWRKARIFVVNCFKMCIFAVASTIILNTNTCRDSCELLQNVYLCSSKHNAAVLTVVVLTVVNCFKMCIFAVASTILM